MRGLTLGPNLPQPGMKILIKNTVTELQAHTAEPVIRVDASEIGERHSLGLTHIDVVGPNGKIARFWIDLQISGSKRPMLKIRTKTGPDRLDGMPQAERQITGSFNFTPRTAGE